LIVIFLSLLGIRVLGLTWNLILAVQKENGNAKRPQDNRMLANYIPPLD
jgi:hypothetical protein